MAGLLLGVAAECRASDFSVAPNDRANLNGNDRLQYTGAVDIVQVYTPANFVAPMNITGVAFRLDENSLGQSFDVVIPRLTLTFSTYSGSRSSFVYNTPTQNAQTLFDSAITWHTTDRTDTIPNPFDFSVTLSQPYAYDPSSGALVMHFYAPNLGGNGGMDLHGPGNGSFGWFVGTTSQPGGLSGVLVTRFEFTQVPEPGALPLFFLGVFGLAIRKRITSR